MVNEGGLRAPERKPLDLKSPDFWDESKLDSEMRRQFDVCHSCRRCFNLCDSFPKLFDLIDNSSSMELDSVKSKDFSPVVDACTLCDMCFMVSCPYVPPHEFAIDIPSLFIRYKSQNKKNNKLSDNYLANTDRNGLIGTFFPKLFNWITAKKNIVFRKILEKLLNIDISATLPQFNFRKFSLILSENIKKIRYKKNYSDKVVIFNTCYVNYNDSKIGEALIQVLNKNSIYYEEGYRECCRMPQLEQGNIHEVRNAAIRTANFLEKKIKEGFKVITPIASCSLMLKSHWPLICPDNENVQLLSKNTLDLDEYLWKLHTEKKLNMDFNKLERNITLHNSCHSRAQNIGPKSAKLLDLLPGVKTINVEKCSGHGGTWGVKKKWNKTARKIGSTTARKVFKEEDNLIASTCPLAGLHLKDINEDKKLSENKEKIFHPIELVAKSYKKNVSEGDYYE